MPARSGGSYVLRGGKRELAHFSGGKKQAEPQPDTEDAPVTAVEPEPSQEPDADEDA
ncbi:hypothetical protein [Salinicola acroporae]|uniref:hypothetical protein n=1 Tax=Salinicola acroporae TaxID=1541440 RepID=UPI0013A6438B|nr:hypothetical protein [Salinicola acroporae]